MKIEITKTNWRNGIPLYVFIVMAAVMPFLANALGKLTV